MEPDRRSRRVPTRRRAAIPYDTITYAAGLITGERGFQARPDLLRTIVVGDARTSRRAPGGGTIARQFEIRPAQKKAPPQA